MAARKRSEAQRAADLIQIERLHLTGRSEYEIADILNAQRPYQLTRDQIHYDLASLAKKWDEEAKEQHERHVAKKIAELLNLKREHYRAWEASYGEHTKTRTEQSASSGKKDKDGNEKQGALRAVIEKEMLLGNPAYLNGILSAIQEECKILGLYKPTKVAQTDVTGEKSYDAGFTDEARIIEITSLVYALRERAAGQTVDDEPATMEAVTGTAD